MFVWREIQDIVGYTGEMIGLRNAMVREVNFIFSKRDKKVDSDPRVAREFEALKKGKERALDLVKDPIKVSKVQVGLLTEVLSALDFKSASLFVQYFGLPLEDVGRDIYHDMRQEKGIYGRLVKEGNISTAAEFLRFFPTGDALNEFEYMFALATETKNNAAVSTLVNLLVQAPFDRLVSDTDFRQLLAKEYDRAELERRIDDASRLIDLLQDPDREKRLKVVEGIVENNYEQAIAYLPGVQNKEAIREVVLEAYRAEMGRGETDVEGLKRAFAFALHGGFEDGEYKRFLEQSANALFEHYVSRPLASESDLVEAERYQQYANPRVATNIFARLLLDLILKNEASVARTLKARFNVQFHPDLYDHVEKVHKTFRQFTETKGIFDLPKGEENLQAALDIATIFNLSDSEIQFVKNQLCKYYLINKKYHKAKEYYVSGKTDVLELIEEIIRKRLRANQFAAVFELLNAVPVTFDKNIRAQHNKELRKNLRENEAGMDFLDMARVIVENDVYALKVLPAHFYYRTIDYAFEYGERGIKVLVELRPILQKRMDGVMRVRLYKNIKQQAGKEKRLTGMVEFAYRDVLPPTFIDWIVYAVRRIFGI